MKTISKINFVDGNTENIAIFDSNLTRFLDANNIAVDASIIKIASDVKAVPFSNLPFEEARVSTELARYCAEGYNGYKPFMAGSSDIRKATSVWIKSEYLPVVGKWAMCGLNTKDMLIATNKYMSYIGLLASASKPWNDVFHTQIDVHRVCVVKDLFVDVDGCADIVANTTIEINRDHAAHINAFDGCGLIRKELTHGEACTGRAPWMKFLVIPDNWQQLRGKTTVDIFGNIVKLDDVDLVLTESCFKAASQYKSWEQYCDAFEELHHEFSVCIREHDAKLKDMPYQQAQTLCGSEIDAEHFARRSADILDGYRLTSNASKLLRKWQSKAAQMYPALLTERHTAKTIQDAYAKKRYSVLGGRLPRIGYMPFIAPDTVALKQHILGLPVTGVLRAGECSYAQMDGGLLDVTRAPHLDNAHVVLNNVRSNKLYGKSIFINIFDLTTIRLRADYDGDHVLVSNDPWLLNLISRTYAKYGNLPVDWVAPKSVKARICKSAIAEFITNLLHGSEIGIYADNLTKLWNNRGFDREVIDWLTYAANVLIDAAKHGNAKIDMPEAVKTLKDVKLPAFCRYAKGVKKGNVEDDAYWADKCAYTDSWLDQYSEKCKAIPETLEIIGKDDMVFDPTIMMIASSKDLKQVPGIWNKGKYNSETGEYDGQGVFNVIAARRSAEWKVLIQQDNFALLLNDWEAQIREEALQEIEAYAESKGKTLDQAYDVITMSVFAMGKGRSEAYDAIVKQAYWTIFGDKCCKVIADNLALRDVPYEDVDFESEEFEIEDIEAMDE